MTSHILERGDQLINYNGAYRITHLGIPYRGKKVGWSPNRARTPCKQPPFSG